MGTQVTTNSKTTEVKNPTPRSANRKPDQRNLGDSLPDRIAYLQRTIGNRAIEGLMKQDALQAKLKVGQPGDIYEQEADRVAEQVMRTPASDDEEKELRRIPEEDEEKKLRCKTDDEEEKLSCKFEAEENQLRRMPEDEEEALQAQASTGQDLEVTDEAQARIDSLRGGGAPLPEQERAFFEPRFGRDFSGVRVHNGTSAAESARAVNARAYTVGQDMVFGAGEYQPGTGEGRRLMAHELTHVVQQRNGTKKREKVNRKNKNKPKIKIINSANQGEKEIVKKAVEKAFVLVDKAQRYMGGKNRFKYAEWFDGNYSLGCTQEIERFERIKNKWVKIYSVLRSKPIILDCSTRTTPHVYASVNIADHRYQIMLKKAFWNAPVSGRDCQAGVIIHELSHEEAGTTCNPNGGLNETMTRNLAKRDPAAAELNANNWEYFAEDFG